MRRFGRHWPGVLLVAGVAVTCCSTGRALAQALQASSARDCAVCHIAWIDSFRRPGAITLMDRPTELTVSESDTCLGCHDGGVGDDRRRVWVEHGHRTGIEPPKDMEIPRSLPLKDGKIDCRTCHTAHTGSGPETIATAVFLRVQNDASQLCQMCHAQYAKGPELGTHPVGGMPFPVPDKLVAAGAERGPDPQRLICQTCHTPHGSQADYLLVMGTESSQLCLTCHTQMRPGLWRPDVGREHPQNPPLTSDAMRQAIRDMGTKTGPGETLICLSCHKLHHGMAGRAMLADTLHDSDLCLRCHPDNREMFGTLHDLRRSAPQERNRLGQTPEVSGPCGACHSFHQFARRPAPQKLDPTGLCATCHQEGECAENKTGLPFSHPSDIHPENLPRGANLELYLPPGEQGGPRTLACLTCHNPHKTSQAHFLRTKPDALCSACHGDKMAGFGEPHDFTGTSLKNARGREADVAGKCGFCHGIHNAPGPALWTATKDTPAGPNEMCVACHRAGGLAAHETGGELRHPSGPATATVAQAAGTPLPLFDAHARQSKDGFVACSTCHDPHGGAGNQQDLLRTSGNGGPSAMCVTCHANARPLQDSLHSEAILKANRSGGDAAAFMTTCGPCHSTHARPGMSEGMWAGPVGGAAYPPDQQHCMGCHGPTGTGPRITPTVHPAVPMRNVAAPDAPGFMPLAGETGTLGADGRITCATCHLSHGLPRGPGMPEPGTVLPIEELRSLKPMVRRYEASNLCASCHGADGLRRFLYYHDPSRRGGR